MTPAEPRETREMASKYHTGDKVRVGSGTPAGHCRTPFYLRGKTGVIHRHLGACKNPEQLAYGKDGKPKKDLYQVRFEQRELWADYPGAAGDTLVADIFEHWLNPAE
jgi:nitrile hydratase